MLHKSRTRVDKARKLLKRREKSRDSPKMVQKSRTKIGDIRGQEFGDLHEGMRKTRSQIEHENSMSKTHTHKSWSKT
jgi:hypothetical protein